MKVAWIGVFLLVSFQLRSFDRSPYPIQKPREEAFLQVSNLHKIFYATYGNPNGPSVIVLHGGPGAGCSDSMTQFFDLNRWNVVMFDQRGAMRSEPFGELTDNSPQHSVADMEALREHLGIGQWFVFGGSWGSSLALLYGQAHPNQCLGFILRGVWLVRPEDYNHLFYGMGKMFPESYEHVINHIPAEERADLLGAYYKRVMNPDPDVHMPAAKIFIYYDLTAGSHLPNPSMVETMMKNDQLVLGVMRTFCHYAKHDFFLTPNQILNQMGQIKHLPAILINGRWDAICYPEMAYLLHKNWPNSQLWIVPDGGHSSNDPSIASALVEATDFFAN